MPVEPPTLLHICARNRTQPQLHLPIYAIPPYLHPHVWSSFPDTLQITWGAPVAAGCNLEVTVEKLKLAAHQRPFYEEQ